MAGLAQISNGLIRINSHNNSIEYSGNGGGTWTPRSFSSEYGIPRDVISLGDDLFLCGSKGFFCSKNGGYTWTMLASSSLYGEFYRVVFDGHYFIAETSKGVHKSDGGNTWTLIHV